MSSKQVATRKPYARSRVTNGVTLLPEVDGRSVWARRMRDVMSLHISDLGGPDAITEAQFSLVRRIAVLTVELETLEQTFALDGHASLRGLDLYTRTAGHLRRMLATLGVRNREHAPVTLDDYLHAKREASA